MLLLVILIVKICQIIQINRLLSSKSVQVCQECYTWYILNHKKKNSPVTMSHLNIQIFAGPPLFDELFAKICSNSQFKVT